MQLKQELRLTPMCCFVRIAYHAFIGSGKLSIFCDKHILPYSADFVGKIFDIVKIKHVLT